VRIESFGTQGRSDGVFCGAVLLWLGIALAFLIGPGASSALAQPPILWGGPPPEETVCPTGTEAGQCSGARGVATDSENGHIFLADSFNRRINEFNPLGQFIKSWGWAVDTGAEELEVCTAASTCQEGTTGSGTGQFGSPQGVAVDSAGNVYVTDRGLTSNQRVQKFDSDGNFLLMFGGEVNKTKVEEREAQEAVPEPVTVSEEEENLCPFDPGDECKAGTVGTGQGQFGVWPTTGDYIAINTVTNTVYVGDVGRIQEFDAAGHYQGEFPVAGTVQGLALDSAGNLYAIYGSAIHKLNPAGEDITPAGGFEVSSPSAVAVDFANPSHVFAFKGGGGANPICELATTDGSLIECFGGNDFITSTGLATNLCPESEAPGNLYVTNPSETNSFLRAYGTEPIGCFRARTLPATAVAETSATLNGTVNPKGEAVSECFFEWGETEAYGQSAQCVPSAGELSGSKPIAVHADISGLTKGTGYHFRLIATIGGETETGSDEEFKTTGPPVISGDHVVAATQTEADLRALVNPEGFATTCGFEYGADASYGQSTPPQAVGEDRSEHAVLGQLDGLTPGTEYHWRIICENSSGTSEGEDHLLRTYLPFAPDADCANQAFRTGASAFLPDCRAYEMVSPVDKNGGDIIRDKSGESDPGNYVQAAPDGDALTYTTNAAFSNVSNVRFNQYIAARTERGQAGEGWSSRGVNIPIAGQAIPGPALSFGLTRQYMAFTPDLCNTWLVDHQTPPPTADGQVDLPNLYRRENCAPDGGLEVLAPAPPALPEGTTAIYVDRNSVQGYSADGSHAVFVAQASLIPDEASPNALARQIYDRFGGELHLVSVLPGGEAAPGASLVGSGWTPGSLENAVSSDGSRVYWSESSGSIYLRLHPEQGIVEDECSDNETVACTVPVSAGAATFRAAARDGSKAIYIQGGDLYEFDLARYEAGGEASQVLAEGIKGVAGVSQDLARVYFVSEEAIAGSGVNSEGEDAVGGEPNLYLAEGEDLSFVATLVAGDVGQKEPCCTVSAYNIAAMLAWARPVRTSADGSRIAFNSRGAPTGYDNADAASGKAAVEVYLYDATARGGEGELLCVSCNPSGARPRGSRELTEPYFPPYESRSTGVFAAAWIPTWEQPLHASNILSAEGKRLFFNANDALLPRDANGAQDVYEWEAVGTGRCTAAKDNPSYFPRNGGCIYLVSTGESSEESEFWEASTDGRDVFFATSSSLLPQDPGNVDLYDARVLGGFPQPTTPAPCEGEACQSPPPSPEFPAPSSSAYSGPANPAHRKPCPKGKRKGKGGKAHCKKGHHEKKGKRHRRGAGKDRRAAR
jgi:hypothetical protein